jgi:hypothetical protein
LLIGLLGATLLLSAGDAGTISPGLVQKNPSRSTLLQAGTIFGPVIFDSYRSADGKNFYQDDSFPSSNGAGAFNTGFGNLSRIHLRSPLLLNSLTLKRAAAVAL